MALFRPAEYPIEIVPPKEVVLANSIILSDLSPEELDACRDDITWSWYVVADNRNGQLITIDLRPSRLGRCYDSFWDRHGIVGSCPAIASSFTDLLSRLVAHRGRYWYWLQSEFEGMGDAYD